MRIAYLSGDLLDFLTLLLSSNIDISKRQHTFWVQAITNRFPETAFFAPGAAYPIDGTGTLLRNPHIAKNEELQLIPYTEKNNSETLFSFFSLHINFPSRHNNRQIQNREL